MDRSKIAEVKRVVVKVGTSTITYPNGKINYEKIEKLARIMTDLQNQGKEMILVSSGAGAAGWAWRPSRPPSRGNRPVPPWARAS